MIGESPSLLPLLLERLEAVRDGRAGPGPYEPNERLVAMLDRLALQARVNGEPLLTIREVCDRMRSRLIELGLILQ